MSKPSYYELLRDPRWQRKRLEVWDRAGNQCEECGDTGTTLNVHHQYYRKGAMPWDYPDDCFKLLCETCHGGRHEIINTLKELFGRIDISELSDILGYVKATIIKANAGPDNSPRFVVGNYEEALGMAAAYGIVSKGYQCGDSVIANIDDAKTIGHLELWSLRNAQWHEEKPNG